MTTYHQLIPGRDTVKNLLKTEPAVVLGVLVGIVAALAAAVTQSTHGGSVDWLTFAALAVPAVCGVVIRCGVFSPATVEQIKADAAIAAKAAAVINVTVHTPATADAASITQAVSDAVSATQPPAAA